MLEQTMALCRQYIAGFGAPSTHLCYHHRLDGPRGEAALSPPEEIRLGHVAGKPRPYGYGSGIQDAALENGQFLYALCEAYETTRNPELAEMARYIFSGMKRIATVSPVKGFVPRGPHPNGKSYYPDSSRDQHCAFIEAMWRYAKSPVGRLEDRAFAAEAVHNTVSRMERNNWILNVEDNSRMAHVGWGWTQHTMIGAATLLMAVGAAGDATGRAHWWERYRDFGTEKAGIRWQLLDAETFDDWRPFTLYSNQFASSLDVIAKVEPHAARRAAVRAFMGAMARRALGTNVLDPACWRRLDWAADWKDEELEPILQTFGLSLTRPATVFELPAHFKPEYMDLRDWRRRKVAEKLLYGIPTVAFHKALLSGDPRCIAAVTPPVEAMVETMRVHGHRYERGENMNRTVILGLLLLARSEGTRQ